MSARLFPLSLAAAALPCVAALAGAQSSKEDSTRTMPGGVPAFSLLSLRGGGDASAVRWNCVGVCAAPAPLSVSGAPAPTVDLQPVATHDASLFEAPGNARPAPASDVAVEATADAAARSTVRRSTTADAEDDETGTNAGTDTGTEPGAFERAVTGGHGSRVAPALLATAAVGAGALYFATQGDNGATSPDASALPINTQRPTLTMTGPVVQPANQATPVPEPATWALLSTGMAGLAYKRRRRA